ncbi:hypothetical protein BDP67DRAFT_496264 [Colletotrichum lupini]|nr:hypothetical protein BDP67DRAFT_496264 [Colletotrichum lupini]
MLQLPALDVNSTVCIDDDNPYARRMKHEALDPVNEGDNVNTNLADADIANASDNANLPAPTSMGLASHNVNTSPDAVHGQPTTTATQDAASASGEHRQLHGDGRSASATSAKKPAVAAAAAAAPFGGRLRVRDPFSGRLVRVPQYPPGYWTHGWFASFMFSNFDTALSAICLGKKSHALLPFHFLSSGFPHFIGSFEIICAIPV